MPLPGVLGCHHGIPAACRLHGAVGHKSKAMGPQPAAQFTVTGSRDHDDPRPTHREHPRGLFQDLPGGLGRDARQHDAAHLTGRQHRKTVAEPQLSAVLTIGMFQRLPGFGQRAGAQVGPDDLGVPARSSQHRRQLAVVAADVCHRLPGAHQFCRRRQTRIQCRQQLRPSLRPGAR